MKSHAINPRALAQRLSPEVPDLTPDDLLLDMKSHPELYYADHVAASRSDGLLPLSDVAWRRVCLGA